MFEIEEEPLHQVHVTIQKFDELWLIFKTWSDIIISVALVNFHTFFIILRMCLFWLNGSLEISKDSSKHFNAKESILIVLKSIDYPAAIFDFILVLPSLNDFSEINCSRIHKNFVHMFILYAIMNKYLNYLLRQG